jgi:hypothetical protein
MDMKAYMCLVRLYKVDRLEFGSKVRQDKQREVPC